MRRHLEGRVSDTRGFLLQGSWSLVGVVVEGSGRVDGVLAVSGGSRLAFITGAESSGS